MISADSSFRIYVLRLQKAGRVESASPGSDAALRILQRRNLFRLEGENLRRNDVEIVAEHGDGFQ